MLIDLVPLSVFPKTVAPLAHQDELETRKVWADVSAALHSKDYATATKTKQALEQAQREKAKEREKNGTTYQPRFFVAEAEGDAWDGRPQLTDEGRKRLEMDFKAEWADEVAQGEKVQAGAGAV